MEIIDFCLFVWRVDVRFVNESHQVLIFQQVYRMILHSFFFFYKKVSFWPQPQNILKNSKLSLKNYLILQIFISLKLS